MDAYPILATVTVTSQGPLGVTADVNGQPQQFPNLEALFGAAVGLLDQSDTSTGQRSDSLPERKDP